MEYKFGKYQSLNQETRWATAEEIEYIGFLVWNDPYFYHATESDEYAVREYN